MMQRVFMLIVLISIVLSSGCMQDGGVIIPLNQTNTTTTVAANETTYVWEDDVLVGKNVTVNGKWLIKPDYDVSKNKFAFWVFDLENTGEVSLYYEPVNTTIGNINFYAYGSFVGTSYYVAHIRLESTEPLEVSVK